jgi:Lon-like ATP-dependent protease
MGPMMGGGTNNNDKPKLIVDNSEKKVIFEDASGAHEGALLGDVLHDPFQSGGLGTPAHKRIVAGMVHKANGGVLFIDEIATLKPEMQQELLTILQEKQMPISGRSERSAGAMVRSTPVPTDFILVAAGNLETLKHMHPALRSRIRGYGYEIYMNNDMEDTIENRNKIIQFIAQEVKADGKIPHFNKSACELLIEEAKRRSEKSGKLTTRFRDLGGLIRASGDIAKSRNSKLVEVKDILVALEKVKSIEGQLLDRYVENSEKYKLIQTSGSQVGKINGLAVMGQSYPMVGKVMPIEAEVTQGGKKHQVNATGKLGEIAKESIINISAVIMKLFGEDIKETRDIYVQFLQTYDGVEGDSASIAIGTAIVSALKNIPIRQDIAITGSLSIKGEVMPIGGVNAKIEGAYESGIRTVVIPHTNKQDLVLSQKHKKEMKIICVERFEEVLLNMLDLKKLNPKQKKVIELVKKGFKVNK